MTAPQSVSPGSGRADEATKLADRIAAWSPSAKGPLVFIARERRLIEDGLRSLSIAQGSPDRDELAAMLIARDEAEYHKPIPDALIEWGRVCIASGKEAVHSGDCTNECHSCARCLTDWSLMQADQIIAALTLPQPSQGAGNGVAVATKLVYVKRWRTIVRLPEKYADEIVEALRCFDAAPQPTTAGYGSWQPIETAPRDGTRIFVTGGGVGSEVDIASYNESVGAWNTMENTLDDRDDEPDGYSRPALWQPLSALALPSTQREGGK